MKKIYDKIFKYNLLIGIVSIIIVTFGLINLYSATNTTVYSGSLFWHQLIFVIIGIIVMIILTIIDYKKLELIVYPSYLFAILLLILVLFLGYSVSGARRWLAFGGLRIQPSEFMKLIMVLVLGKYFSKTRNIVGYSLRDLFYPFVLALIPALLIIIEPDLGTGLLLLMIVFSIFLFVKIKKSLIITMIIVGSVSLPLAYKFGLKDYQKRRVITFIDPSTDPKGAGYNSIQSKIAVGSGRLIGKGYMKGTQSQLNFLPEHHTDFIFSVFAEEHGFLGSLVLLILYALMLISGVRIAYKAGDKLGALIAVGLTSIFFWHILINIGMVLGMLPVVGVTLPFMSYGGTSIITFFAMVGILQSISIRRFMF